MAMSMTLLAAGDAVIRVMGEAMTVGQIIAIRGIAVIILIAGLMAWQKIGFDRAYIFNRWSVLRGCAEMVSTYCFFLSLQLIPIATSTTVVFIFPVLLTLVSIPLYGEKVGVFRWIAVLMGFAGVIMVAAPDGGDFNIALALPFTTALALVARDLLTRKIPDRIQAPQVTMTTAIVTTFFGLLTFPFGWGAMGTIEWALVPLSALLVALSFTLYISAIRKGELSIIAPAQYLVILWATFWGALIWQEWPGQNAVIGGTLIIAAGCLIIWRERVAQQRQEKSPEQV